METELLNAVKYIKKFTCKEDLGNIIDSFIENGLIQVRGDRENAAFQIANEVNISQVSPLTKSINDSTENTEENHIQQNKEKYCGTMETLMYDPGVMNEKLDWICWEIEKIKEFQAVVENKFTMLELTNTTPVQPVELNAFNEVYRLHGSLNRTGEMDFKAEGPWNTPKYFRPPSLADKKKFWILHALQWLKQ